MYGQPTRSRGNWLVHNYKSSLIVFDLICASSRFTLCVIVVELANIDRLSCICIYISNFMRSVDLVEFPLREQGFTFTRYDGRLDRKERERRLTQLKTDSEVRMSVFVMCVWA